ncbi:MAG: hypothetical protein CVV02_04965 [Firmicutes bacterium HGW-Firmicutes-7]|nr:MAG: hypothetical protein CVV02_04965 [Firmicutes bacterium HGW-Firmicutes-7]
MTVDELMELDRSFCEAVSKLSEKAWGSHYAMNGVMLVKLGENIIGEPNVYAAMKTFFKQKGSTLLWSPENGGISDAGDLGYTYGQYIRHYRNESGMKIKETGRYMTIWRKQTDHAYKIEVQMDN